MKVIKIRGRLPSQSSKESRPTIYFLAVEDVPEPRPYQTTLEDFPKESRAIKRAYRVNRRERSH